MPHARLSKSRLRRARRSRAAAAEEGPVKGEKLAESQDIPLQFLEHILLELKHAGIVRARRGAKGGYWLARPADEITIADVVRAVEGPIANVQSAPPESIAYRGNAEHLQEVWIAVRANLRAVLEQVTLADLVSGELPHVGQGPGRSPGRLGAPLAGSGRIPGPRHPAEAGKVRVRRCPRGSRGSRVSKSLRAQLFEPKNQRRAAIGARRRRRGASRGGRSGGRCRG